LIAVFQDPRDVNGNVLNSFAVRRALPACTDTATDKPWCCELNSAVVTRQCFGANTTGQCGGCGDAAPFLCRTTENCQAGACVNFIGPWNCTGVSCVAPEGCCYGGCRNYLTDNQACGGCGNACAANQRCCNGTCKTMGTNTDCRSCGDACNGQTCCPPTGCVNLTNDNDNCGACGRRCDMTKGFMCVAGHCVYQADPAHCGITNQTCLPSQWCCPMAGTTTDFRCVPLSTAMNCGKCNEICNPNRCRREIAGVRVGAGCDDNQNCSAQGICSLP
jgi:hypothetical protein